MIRITDAPRRPGEFLADLRAAAVVAGRAGDDWLSARLGLPPLAWLARRAAARARTRWGWARWGPPPAEGPVLAGVITNRPTSNTDREGEQSDV